MKRELKELGALVIMIAAGFAAIEYWRPERSAFPPIIDRIGLAASIFAIVFLGMYLVDPLRRIWLCVRYAAGWAVGVFVIISMLSIEGPRAIPGLVVALGAFTSVNAYFWGQKGLGEAIGLGIATAFVVGVIFYFV
jgi:hypothetical protein